jgi:multiple sugar transport system ATP-binding protein
VSPTFSIPVNGPGVPRVEGTSVRIGIRPHDITLVSAADADGNGRVEVVEPLGPATIVHLRLDGVPDQLVRVLASDAAPIYIDDQVSFRLRRDRLLVFDSESGRALDVWFNGH